VLAKNGDTQTSNPTVTASNSVSYDKLEKADMEEQKLQSKQQKSYSQFLFSIKSID